MVEPVIRIGDASISSPFTCRNPSITCALDIIQQGRCTLLNVLQQQQIMMLECLISAFTLSTLSLQGSRSSEIQLMSTGILLMVASFSFTYTSPVEVIDRVKPLHSLFHPAIFLSIIGQALIHLTVMWYGVHLTKGVLGEEKIKQLTIFFRNIEIRQLNIELNPLANKKDLYTQFISFWSVPFMPNLLNTSIFLLRTSQEISILLVNYKGRPWMKGFVENHTLSLTTIILISYILCAALTIFPQLNRMLQLVEFPDDQFRFTIIKLIGASLMGALIWDRICLMIFASRIFKKILDNVKQIIILDLIFILNSVFKILCLIIILSTGNILLMFGSWYLYKKYLIEGSS